MIEQKKQMQEAAVLYYEKGYTQSEIAKELNLSRQTVSKLLSLAIEQKVVEIKINNPQSEITELEKELAKKFGIKKAVVSGVSCDNEHLCRLNTVKTAVEYVKKALVYGNKKIGVSWGRTIESFITEFTKIKTDENVVFPLFGATNQKQSYFISNELARNFADKIGAKVEYAWFPYMPKCDEDSKLFQKTSYFKDISDLWSKIDIAIIGIGNTEMNQTFGKAFGFSENSRYAIGDLSTHFYDKNGDFLDLYPDTLCASHENLLNAKETIAIASGVDKVEAIIGGLKTKVIDTLITDEYTAQRILSYKE